MSTTAFDLPCTPVPGGRRFAALHALGLGLVIACTSLAAHAADPVVTVVEQVQLVWRSSFKVKDGTSEEDARKAIAGIYRLGLDNLATSFD